MAAIYQRVKNFKGVWILSIPTVCRMSFVWGWQWAYLLSLDYHSNSSKVCLFPSFLAASISGQSFSRSALSVVVRSPMNLNLFSLRKLQFLAIFHTRSRDDLLVKRMMVVLGIFCLSLKRPSRWAKSISSLIFAWFCPTTVQQMSATLVLMSSCLSSGIP